VVNVWSKRLHTAPSLPWLPDWTFQIHVSSSIIQCIMSFLTKRCHRATRSCYFWRYECCGQWQLDLTGLAASWECLCFYDAILFCLTFYRAVQTRHSSVKSSLLSLIFRDGEYRLLPRTVVSILTFTSGTVYFGYVRTSGRSTKCLHPIFAGLWFSRTSSISSRFMWANFYLYWNELKSRCRLEV
jgi:hypothetical protein